MSSQAELIRNLKRCPRFEQCNRNLCPLDLELEKRYGGNRCFWMREGEGTPRVSNLGGGRVQTHVAGAQMPDELLVHVPESNVSRLNDRSRTRWQELRAQTDPENAPEAAKSSHIYDKLVLGGSTVE